MATRIMISLKKAAAEPMGPWSLETMTDVHFTSPMHHVSREISETHTTPNEEAIELGIVGHGNRASPNDLSPSPHPWALV